MADAVKMMPALPTALRGMLDQRTQRVTDAPVPAPIAGGWPVVRLNALKIDPVPASCRLIVCGIGGTKEVRDAVERSGVSLVVARRQLGVIAFGSDADVRRAFGTYGITAFDLHPLAVQRLRFDSAELGLLYDALSLAIARERPLIAGRRGRAHIVHVDPARAGDARLAPLRAATGAICGTVPQIRQPWAEAIRLRLEYRFDALWLLIEPTVWVEASNERAASEGAGEFIRAKLAGRFNSDANEVLAAWASVLTGGADIAELRAFGGGDGVDAAFSLHRATAFSHRRAPAGPSTTNRTAASHTRAAT
jgi:hypothetical protein